MIDFHAVLNGADEFTMSVSSRPSGRSKVQLSPRITRRAPRRVRAGSTLIGLVLSFGFALDAAALPNFVDLRPQQTAIRDQGGRTTCITFAALAALEAAYKRAGYGDLDLSEQFTNHVGKTFWLHAQWPEIVALGEDGAEGQVGAYGGGGGSGYLAQLANGLRVPEEGVMPYRNREYTPADWAPLSNVWHGPYWKKQRNQSDFNLNPIFLPPAALKARRYYSARGVEWVDARSAAAIEAVLATGREVVWDFLVANIDGPVWRSCRPGEMGCPNGAHAMLLVGYDRRDRDPRNHYFIAKNSWGPTGVAGAAGFTYISYDYLQDGSVANAVTGVNPPAPWEELRFVGRWDLNFDGWKGKLDIYHLPHQMEWVWSQYGVTGISDERIGTFYDAAGKAFRVNGSVSGQHIRFYLDVGNPNIRWDQISGREFNYNFVNGTWGEIIAGVHRDGDGRIYGGYAKKQGLLSPGTAILRPVTPLSYMAANWSASWNRREGTFRFNRIDNSFLTPAEAAVYTGLAGQLVWGEGTFAAQALVERSDANEIRIRVSGPLGAPARLVEFYGRLLNWERGVVAGSAVPYSGRPNGFVMIRQ